MNTPLQYLDIASVLNTRCIAEGLIPLDTVKPDFSDLTRKFFRSYISSHKFNKLNINRVEDYSKSIEEKIISLCSDFSTHELFYWYRRIRPNRIRDKQNAHCYHELMKTSMFSYGKQTDLFVSSNTGYGTSLTPKYIINISEDNISSCDIPIEIIRVLSAVYKLEWYCFYYIHINNCIRTMIKGGNLYLCNEYGLRAHARNTETSKLIDYYDQRSNRETLLTAIGTHSLDQDQEQQIFRLCFLQQNFDNEQQELFSSVKWTPNKIGFNFILSNLNIYDYYKVLREFNNFLLTKFNFKSEEFIATLLCFSSRLIADVAKLVAPVKSNTIDELRAITLMQRGYLLMNNTDSYQKKLNDDIVSYYKELFPGKKIPETRRFLAVIEYLYFSAGHHASLETLILKSSLLNKVTKDRYIIDHTSYPMVLKKLVSSLRSVDGQLGNIISTDFEEKVNQAIAKVLGSKRQPIRGDVYNSSGAKKEIDASFVVGQYLFIIECKSLSVSDASLFGGRNAVDFRNNKLSSFLEESEEKAKFLASNCDNGLTQPIPKKITHLIPVVMTSFSEFAWEYSDQLFITNQISRLLIVDDLEAFVNNDSFLNLESKPFAIPIERHGRKADLT